MHLRFIMGFGNIYVGTDYTENFRIKFDVPLLIELIHDPIVMDYGSREKKEKEERRKR